MPMANPWFNNSGFMTVQVSGRVDLVVTYPAVDCLFHLLKLTADSLTDVPMDSPAFTWSSMLFWRERPDAEADASRCPVLLPFASRHLWPRTAPYSFNILLRNWAWRGTAERWRCSLFCEKIFTTNSTFSRMEASNSCRIVLCTDKRSCSARSKHKHPAIKAI